jgi:RimJ/RimL family protein N-acetyltransferase
MSSLNEWGQPVGPALPGFRTPPAPRRTTLEGRSCIVEPLDPERHAQALFDATVVGAPASQWTYLPYGPFDGFSAYRHWLSASAATHDPLFFAVIDRASQRAAGLASYLRITPSSASIEVGHLNFSPLLQRRCAATEAMYLMMRAAFELGYRRFEWKCDALNQPSRSAAQRLGFSFEGIFRQATVYKGRSRDTAWYAVIDADWPALRRAHESWLEPSNFDQEGRQRSRLSQLTGALLVRRG